MNAYLGFTLSDHLTSVSVFFYKLPYWLRGKIVGQHGRRPYDFSIGSTCMQSLGLYITKWRFIHRIQLPLTTKGRLLFKLISYIDFSWHMITNRKTRTFIENWVHLLLLQIQNMIAMTAMTKTTTAIGSSIGKRGGDFSKVGSISGTYEYVLEPYASVWPIKCKHRIILNYNAYYIGHIQVCVRWASENNQNSLGEARWS